MAKKGQAVQLQTEINSDEDWEKLLQKDGLIVVDIYSEWCGPCSGMAATLKKLKLEIGGDTLQLAIAKCDRIQALERFRNKSEPTWMFISGGKMVNFMFGASAPRLTQLITEELKKETEAKEGKRERGGSEISELADEERVRFEAKEKIALAAKAAEEAKSAKELRERRVAECQNILNNLPAMGVILVFPHAKDRYMEVFGDLLLEAALAIQTTEKIRVTSQMLDELFYFEENPFSEDAIHQLITQESLLVQLKPMASHDPDETMEEAALKLIYGKSKTFPGDPNCAAQVLKKIPVEEEEESREMVALWTPENEMTRATFFRLFYSRLVENWLIPEPEPIPPHFAVVFEASRRREIVKVMQKNRQEILHYGFFSSEKPEEAQLVTKSLRNFNKITNRTLNEKLVIQLAKRKSECVLTFAQLQPQYMSPNTSEGERECKLFFPDHYDEDPVDEDDLEIEEIVMPTKEEPVVEIAEEIEETEGAEEIEAVTLEEGAEEAVINPQDFEGVTIIPTSDNVLPSSDVVTSLEIVAPYPETSPSAPGEPAPEPAPFQETVATESVQLTEDSLEELFYFSETQPPEVLMEEMLSTKTTALLLKRSPENLPSTIDDVISQMVYGNLRKPPGDDNCPYRVGLLTNDNGSEIPAFWTPPNPHAKATALKLLFPNISGPYKLPEVVPIPPHVAVGYDAFKYEDVIELAAQYPGQVMKYGFFTSDIPGDAQLIAKTVEKFEKRETPHTYEEKIIIQLAKTQADCILAFSELGPSYMSANVVQGEDECKIFFPEGYDIPEESVAEVKKKSKKKSKAKPAVHVQEGDASMVEDKETTGDVAGDVVETGEGEEAIVGEAGEEEASDGKDGEEEEEVGEADKATSPINGVE